MSRQLLSWPLQANSVEGCTRHNLVRWHNGLSAPRLHPKVHREPRTSCPIGALSDVFLEYFMRTWTSGDCHPNGTLSEWRPASLLSNTSYLWRFLCRHSCRLCFAKTPSERKIERSPDFLTVKSRLDSLDSC